MWVKLPILHLEVISNFTYKKKLDVILQVFSRYKLGTAEGDSRFK